MNANYIKVYTLLLIFFTFSLESFCQTTYIEYENTNSADLNANTDMSRPIIRYFEVTEDFIISDLNVGINITHTYRGDVQIQLIAPSGTTVVLLSGGENKQNYNLMFDDNSTNSYSNGLDDDVSLAYTNRYAGIPVFLDQLSILNGESAKGTWELRVWDSFEATDDGTFNKAMLQFNTNPCYAEASGKNDADNDNVCDICDTDSDNDGILDNTECEGVNSIENNTFIGGGIGSTVTSLLDWTFSSGLSLGKSADGITFYQDNIIATELSQSLTNVNPYLSGATINITGAIANDGNVSTTSDYMTFSVWYDNTEYAKVVTLESERTSKYIAAVKYYNGAVGDKTELPYKLLGSSETTAEDWNIYLPASISNAGDLKFVFDATNKDGEISEVDDFTIASVSIITCIDSDGDNIPNNLDIDSDMDGIIDNIEAQATSSFSPAEGVDRDFDGLDDAYDTDNEGVAIVITDTDNDGIKDYLDVNSDNDGTLDHTEAYDTDLDGVANTLCTDNDSDGDGLDDAFDADGVSCTNNAGSDNGTQCPAFFPSSSGTERNWRDVSVSLPIDLVSFDVKKENDCVRIDWLTASEINNDYFTIERSINTIDFYSIANIQGAGNSTNLINYRIIDNECIKGKSYYRLKQTDYDGLFSYSNIRSVSFGVDEGNVEINAVSPNPIVDQWKINFVSPSVGVANLQIFNMQGQLVYTKEIETNKGFNTSIQNKKLETGIYYLIITTNKSQTDSQKIIFN